VRWFGCFVGCLIRGSIGTSLSCCRSRQPVLQVLLTRRAWPPQSRQPVLQVLLTRRAWPPQSRQPVLQVLGVVLWSLRCGRIGLGRRTVSHTADGLIGVVGLQPMDFAP
jgi:hypothetical protein